MVTSILTSKKINSRPDNETVVPPKSIRLAPETEIKDKFEKIDKTPRK